MEQNKLLMRCVSRRNQLAAASTRLRYGGKRVKRFVPEQGGFVNAHGARFKVLSRSELADLGGEVRFHFQVRTGTHVMVTESSDLSDTNEARVEAARRIGLLLHKHAGQLWADENWQMDVTDETGLILFVIDVHAMKTSATINS